MLITASLFAMGTRGLDKMSDVMDLSVGCRASRRLGVEVRSRHEEAGEAKRVLVK